MSGKNCYQIDQKIQNLRTARIVAFFACAVVLLAFGSCLCYAAVRHCTDFWVYVITGGPCLYFGIGIVLMVRDGKKVKKLDHTRRFASPI